MDKHLSVLVFGIYIFIFSLLLMPRILFDKNRPPPPPPEEPKLKGSHLTEFILLRYKSGCIFRVSYEANIRPVFKMLNCIPRKYSACSWRNLIYGLLRNPPKK